MMLGEEQWRQECSPPLASPTAREFALEPTRFSFSLSQRHRGQKRTEPARREAQVGLHHALELHPGLVVEDIESRSSSWRPIARGSTGGMTRKGGVVLLARETLLLRGGDDFAVAHQRGRAIVIIGGDAEDSFCHRFALDGVRLIGAYSAHKERGFALASRSNVHQLPPLPNENEPRLKEAIASLVPSPYIGG